MVSQAAQGEVVRINATLSAGGETLQGTYTITGTCGAGKTGQMTGRRVDWTGIWTGTIGAIPTVFDMQMASTPDGEANYVLSGTVTFSNTQCFPKAVITRRARGRVAFPDVVGDTQRLEIIAEISEDLSTMSINSVLVAGTCPELVQQRPPRPSVIGSNVSQAFSQLVAPSTSAARIARGRHGTCDVVTFTTHPPATLFPEALARSDWYQIVPRAAAPDGVP